MTSTDADPLRNLALLGSVAADMDGYYRALTGSDDSYLVAAGWCRRLEAGAIRRAMWDDLLGACVHGGVAKAAFEYFESIFEHDLAREAASRATRSLGELRNRAFHASLAFDHATAAEVQGDYFLENDDIGHLLNAAKFAERAAGWRGALPWSVRAVLAAPQAGELWSSLLLRLTDARQDELLDSALAQLARLAIHPELVQLFRAEARLRARDPEGCLALIADLDEARIAQSSLLSDLRIRILGLRFQALDALSRYHDAYVALRKRHEAERAKSADPKDFSDAIRRMSSLSVPALPDDPRDDVVQMLGFPRSGTTLLENALGRHRQIETFEEIPAQLAMFTRLGNELASSRRQQRPLADAYMAARGAYYLEVDRRRQKLDATVLVEKMPISSADAYLLRRIFPKRRYIFSIRHPFDAVLSCMRQTFITNPAMANFLSIESAAAIYDLTMSQWFSQFRIDDPLVYYVRYENLVLEFDRTMHEIIAFLGVDWDPGVQEFAEAAQDRSARTPSYQKVRQGLSIGVQTAWRNYGFLFEMPEAKPLHKWAEHFGYPTK